MAKRGPKPKYDEKMVQNINVLLPTEYYDLVVQKVESQGGTITAYARDAIIDKVLSEKAKGRDGNKMDKLPGSPDPYKEA